MAIISADLTTAALPISTSNEARNVVGVELRARFSGRILSIGEDIADRWGLLAAGAKRRGKSCRRSMV
jgi:predicted nucleic acid-binding protein